MRGRFCGSEASRRCCSIMHARLTSGAALEVSGSCQEGSLSTVLVSARGISSPPVVPTFCLQAQAPRMTQAALQRWNDRRVFWVAAAAVGAQRRDRPAARRGDGKAHQMSFSASWTHSGLPVK